MRAVGVTLLLGALAFGGATWAAPPKLVLLLVTGVSAADVAPGGPYEKLRTLAERGSVGLAEIGLPGEPTEAAAFLTVGAGVPLAVPDKAGPRVREGGIDLTMAEVATLVFRSDTREGAVVCRGYRKRYGRYAPLRSRIVHLGVGTLSRLPENARSAGRIGELGERWKRAGKRVRVVGNWAGVLVAMDRRYAVYDGSLRTLAPREIGKVLKPCDILVVSEDRPRQGLTLAMALEKLARRQEIHAVILCLPRPLADNPTPGLVFGLGPSFPPDTVLTGNREGWAALTDLAPTLSRLAGTEFATDSGRPLRATGVVGGSMARIEGHLKWHEFVRHWGLVFQVVFWGTALALSWLVLAAAFTRWRRR
ncbi:MAG: hypothetical protein SFU56_12990 [Capsulimonadales bacterium]|nr:hypothetical protein [Capsulimonadales bacterium]